MNFERLWTKACLGSSRLQCRKKLIELSLLRRWSEKKASANPDSVWSRIRSLERTIAKSWPKDGIKVINPKIANRAPDEFPIHAPLPPKLNPLSVREEIVLFDPAEHVFFSFTATPYKERGGVTIAESMVSDQEFKLIYDTLKGNLSKVKDALNSAEIEKELKANSPPDWFSFFQRLWKCAGVPLPESNWMTEKNFMPPLESMVETPTEFSINPKYPTLHLFKKNCMSCHINQPEERMNFMAEKDDSVLWEKLAKNPEIQRRIDYEAITEAERMPPAKSKQGQSLRNEGGLERIQMLSDLNRQKAGSCGLIMKEIGQ
jgi:hypothetical protein